MRKLDAVESLICRRHSILKLVKRVDIMGDGIIRVCVTGARSSLNLGTASIVISGIREIDRRMGVPVEFVIVSPNVDIDNPNYQEMISGKSLRVVGPAYTQMKSYSLRTLALLFYCLREFRNCDMVVDMRGEGFATLRVTIAQSIQLMLCAALGKPYAIYAQSIGPFNGRLARCLARLVLRKSEFVTLRETISMSYYDGLSVGRPAIMAADQAVLMDPAPRYHVDRILGDAGIEPGTTVVGVSPISEPDLVRLMVSACDHIVETYGVVILLIPHARDQTEGGCIGNDDLSSCQEIHSLMANRNRSVILDGLNAAEAKGVMKLCELYVTCRWHAGIASLSAGTPTVVIGSKHKSAAVKQFGAEECFIKSDMASITKLTGILDKCWADRARMRLNLRAKAELVRESALISSRLVTESIRKHKMALRGLD